MSVKCKRHVRRLVFSLLPAVLIGITFGAPVILPAGTARGTQPSDWVTVASAIDSFIQNQYSATDGGEAGFLVTATQLKTRIDPLGNNTFLGEGADAANAPVLVDVLTGWGKMVPATSMGVTENSNAANTTNAPALAALVQAHRDAGMSTDIVTYCWTGHVDNKVAMAYGAMAQAGYFGITAPRVYALKWGRQGWNFAITSAPVYPSTTGDRPYAASAVAPTPSTLPATVPGGCTSAGGNAELVRCAAQWALVNLGAAGVSPWASTSDGSYKPVDLRSTIDSYPGSGSTNGTPYAFSDPLNTLFNATGGTYDNLARLSTAQQNIFYNRTQHSALLAAQGAKMLNFNVSALRWGLPYWNATNPPNWQEKLVAPGNSYPCLGASPCSGTAAIDTTAPSITVAPSVSGVTESSATFSWTTSEPTTAKVQIGTSSGVYTIVDNSTILHANHNGSNARAVGGLSSLTTYYYVVTSYDGNTNSITSLEQSFTTTAPPDTTPPVITVPASITAEATGPSGTAVTYAASATDPDDAVSSFGCTPASGSTFPLGATAVSCSATDSHANTASAGFSVTVTDTTAPVVNVPADLTAEATGPSGASVSFTASATDLVDGAVATTCTPASGSTFPLGATAVSCSATDSHANTASAGFSVTVTDTTAPVVNNVMPTSSIETGSPTISADFADSGSGIDPATAVVLLDGAPVQGCSTSSAGVSCPTAGLSQGSHNITVNVSDLAGVVGSGTGSFSVDIKFTYFFPWYDNDAVDGMKGDWIMIANKGATAAAADIFIGGTKEFSFDDGAGEGHGGLIAPGGQVSWQAPNVIMGGPVKVVSNNGNELLVSQRVIYRDSFNEIVARDVSELSSDNYFAWYDNNAGWGMKRNWIVVGNAGSSTAVVNLFIGDQTVPKTTMLIPPSGTMAWQAPSTVTSGPVRVTDTNGNRLVVSQRVIYNDAFNEVLGVPREKIDTEGYFTWYDNNASWGMNGDWVLATNLGDQPTTVQIYIHDVSNEPVATLGPIGPGEMVTWQAPDVTVDGPVRVISPPPYSQTLLVSQRVVFKDSFEEVQGISPHDMATAYSFNWYDFKSAGMGGDWILIGNENDSAHETNITIGDNLMSVDGSPTLVVGSRSSIFPSFSGLMDGPIGVSCTSCSPAEQQIISQRVIYLDSFNEVVGRPPRVP